MYGIIHHREEEILQHFGNAARRRSLRAFGRQLNGHGEKETCRHGGRRRCKRTNQVNDENRLNVTVGVHVLVGDRRPHEYENEHGCHGLQCGHKKRPQKAHVDSKPRHEVRRKRAQDESNDNLLHERPA